MFRISFCFFGIFSAAVLKFIIFFVQHSGMKRAVSAVEEGNNGESYLRHNDEANLVEDEAEVVSGDEAAQGSNKKNPKKTRAPVSRPRGGTNVSAINAGAVASRVDAADALQDQAQEMLSMLRQSMSPGLGSSSTSAATSSAPAFSFEQEMALIAAKSALAEKEALRLDKELTLKNANLLPK